MVDDDPQVRSALAKAVESQGLACRQAGNAAEALEILAADGEFPVCISDIQMPGMNGVDFLHEAVARFPDMAVIMLTGVAEVTTAIECLRTGAMDYIAKPAMIEEVGARITKALEFLRQPFVQLNDIVEGFADFAVDAGNPDRQPHREVALTESAQGRQQLVPV